jgi:H+-transporting ATPase
VLCVAGHMTILPTRTHGPSWSILPARIPVVAASGPQALAMQLAAYGVLTPPLGWALAFFVWGYTMGRFL